MVRICGIGACVYDTLAEVKEYPKEDRKVRAERMSVSGGGPVGTALVAAARLGAQAEYLGVLSNDGAGDFLVQDFERYGVLTGRIRRINGSSFSSFIILSEKEATRTCIFDRGTLPDDFKNIDLEGLASADILHLDGNSLNSAICAAKYARERRIKVSLDAGGLYEGIEKLVPLVDILVTSEEWALGFTGEKSVPAAMEKLYKKYRPEALVVTCGKKGGYYWNAEKGACAFPSFSVEAVDSNGAGDVFHGAFLVAYGEGKSVADSCRFAALTAALKCTRVGARTATPMREEVDRLLSGAAE